MDKLTKILIVLLSVSILFIVLLLNKDIEKSTIVINPLTKERVLPNGQVSQVKVNTPSVDNPTDAGFTKKYINDTIKKILKVKEKEILALNKIKGTYRDSLIFTKQELNSNKELVKYYESKDKKGNVIGTIKLIDNTQAIYNANITLTTVVKKGKKADSLIFYDPTQRITINESTEFRYVVKKPSKLKIGISVGVGYVVPLKQGFKPNFNKSNIGYFIGPSLQYNF